MYLNRVVNFIGIGIDAITYDDMFARIDGWLKNKQSRSHHIACINAFCATLAVSNQRLARIYNSADIVGADGMPFVWWIRTVLKMKCDRLAAPEIVLEIAKRSEREGYTFYLYGGTPEIVFRMKEYLEDRFPYIKIIGTKAPPFRPLSDDEDRSIVEEINHLRPDIVCVGLGTPKQDYWIEDHLYRIHGTVMIASGATFDFFGGRIRMAPQIIRSSGFEWLYRLMGKDFRRLWKRYTVMNALFLWHFMLQLSGLRVRAPDRMIRSECNSSN